MFRISLWLGMIGFGGGISVLSNIHSVTVVRRRWLTEREFTNTATVAQMLPGGAATNALAYIGLRFLGPVGALASYIGFILPGAAGVLVLAWFYVRYGATPHVERMLAGVNAAVVGIIVAITWKMVRTSISRLWQMGVAAGALIMSLLGGASSGEVALVGIATGLFVDLGLDQARLWRSRVGRDERATHVALPEEGDALPPAGRHAEKSNVTLRMPVLIGLWLAGALLARGLGSDLIKLGLVFLRTGLGAYGGGFAIIPHLQTAMHNNGWLTDRQFADAIAVGKLTPGPVLLMATFIGYVLHGWAGALVATVAIFSAPFALTVLLATWLDRLRSRPWVRAGLRGLTPAVVGLMAAAGLTLGFSLQGTAEVAIAACVALTMGRFELNPALMLALAGGARIGLGLVMR